METYATQDFYLASYLFLNGNQIKETKLKDRHTTEFLFEEKEELHAYVDDFYNMKAVVNPLSYGSALRSIKSMIHALKGAHTHSNSRVNNYANNKQKGSSPRN